MHEDEYPLILTPEQAARFLQLNEDTIRRLLRNRQIPGRKVGKEWRLSRRALEEWVASYEPQAETENEDTER